VFEYSFHQFSLNTGRSQQPPPPQPPQGVEAYRRQDGKLNEDLIRVHEQQMYADEKRKLEHVEQAWARQAHKETMLASVPDWVHAGDFFLDFSV
jgi:hypothetical protein